MKIPEIVRLNYITGNYSMFIEIVCKDINQLRYVLHDELQKIKEEVDKTSSSIDKIQAFIQRDESKDNVIPLIIGLEGSSIILSFPFIVVRINSFFTKPKVKLSDCTLSQPFFKSSMIFTSAPYLK